jgi:hypothetical protein
VTLSAFDERRRLSIRREKLTDNFLALLCFAPTLYPAHHVDAIQVGLSTWG